jgi:PAS domain S-box-containing protein
MWMGGFMGNRCENLHGTPVNNQDVRALTLYRFIIDSLPVAVTTVDSELKITSFNPWAEKVTGYSEKQAMGRYCGDILQGAMCHTQCPVRTVLGCQHPIARVETTIQNKWGENIPVKMNTAALLDDHGKLIGAVEAFQDISDLKGLEFEKANLVSMIAHDMKSPLVTIRAALRLLNKGPHIGEYKQKRYLQAISKESNRLLLLIKDFIEVSHLQARTLDFNFGPTSLDEQMLELLNTYVPRASQRGIEMKIESPRALPMIKADARRLRRVFTNLLDNALKFSKKQGTVTIKTQQTDQEVIVKIMDQGIGIDPKDLPHIFYPFYRGEHKRKRDGYGLGLAAVKAIVEGHGGRVLVRSELGKGSVFSVVLPKLRERDNDNVEKWAPLN